MEKCRARMRLLEGIGPDAPLAGSATIHTLRRDDRKGMMILSDKDERQIIAKTRLGALVAFVFMAVMIGVAALVLAEERICSGLWSECSVKEDRGWIPDLSCPPQLSSY